ncbi:hypothetical protein [Mycolicibacterium brumae]|uniref:Uncharacterized protein n=1 Tax=Mycolicibacterium brumae TaxID=85968 RepID=A0A2G5PF21_9MYCO|nr:hypothetical protein [Mycolicibacterium brumae]MCV7191617.1 hypothetical protein [Mycolicibacterium brumae]PIB76917.1 hypothetical protein CQY22_004595 [Mycolicibacterium brumae]RWA20529.1 hypothetical protein MBRU_02400 [Mycolicibacterium brumae DSM 44177]UWW07625.1 hypothetical protein L2Z93_000649 [Mycolicibacterium brumae]
MTNIKTAFIAGASAAVLAISLPVTAAADTGFDQPAPGPNSATTQPQWTPPVSANNQQLTPRSQRQRYNYRNDYFKPTNPNKDSSPSSGRSNF